MSSAERPTGEQQQAFQRACSALKRIESKRHRAEVKARHAMGEEINKILGEPNKYGRRKMKAIAQATGISETRLYDYGRVAKVISREQIQQEDGLPWSHWVQLARVADAGERDRLIKQTADEQLPVRAIGVRSASASREGRVVGSGGEPVDGESAGPSQLNKATAELTSMSAHVAGMRTKLGAIQAVSTVDAEDLAECSKATHTLLGEIKALKEVLTRALDKSHEAG